jgi:pectin methylesterase-like acyl-CoA thioesterase
MIQEVALINDFDRFKRIIGIDIDTQWLSAQKMANVDVRTILVLLLSKKHEIKDISVLINKDRTTLYYYLKRGKNMLEHNRKFRELFENTEIQFTQQLNLFSYDGTN